MDDSVNSRRVRYTWNWFADVHGVSFHLPLASQLSIMEQTAEDLVWLRETLERDVFAENLPRERKQTPAWSGETLRGIALDLNDTIRRDQARMLFLEGRISRFEGNPEAAKESFKQSFAMDPECYGALWNYLDLLFRDNECEALRSYIARISKSYSNDAVILRLCGELFTRLANWLEAQPLLERSVSLGENSGQAHYFLALTLFHLGQLERAEQLSRRSTELMPNLPHFHRHLGHVLYANGKMEAAVDSMRQALDCGDSCGFTWHILSKALAALGRDESARAASRRACDLEPENEHYRQWSDKLA